MEEEVLSWKHVCKFCRKRFQCGRSLGGHMRSHMVNHVSTLTDGTLITRKKLPFLMKSEDEDDDEDSSNNINNGSCSGTSGVEEEKEQEEVAMCLMLLSRDDDVLSNSPSDDDESSASNKKGTVHVVMKSEIETETTTTTTDVLGDGVLDSEVICKFECETCSKTFHSYQALGGHRASHKRIKGCSFFKTHDHGGSKLIMITSINSEKKKSSSSDRIHECLICFKGFPSGQALGGHKRSHLLETSPRTRVPAEEEAAADAKIPVPGMEDFLVDLNLPAKVDEERNSTIVNNQWWTGSKHK